MVDVDSHHWPNLPLMKLSAWHKQSGDCVEWWDGFKRYDRVYLSRVFSDTYSSDMTTVIQAREVIRGGTGYAIQLVEGQEVYRRVADPALPPGVEHIYPDYSLYPILTADTAFGFLSRGCPRACPFCLTTKKEGPAHKVADLTEFWTGQRKIKLLDPNLLACPDCEDMLEQLAASKAQVDFSQGLDARLMTVEVAELLGEIRAKVIHFAMDDMAQIPQVLRGLDLYRPYGKPWQSRKVYVLTNYNTTHDQDMERIRLIQEHGYKPYVMIYNRPSAQKITKALQRWCNNPVIYHSVPDFSDYLGQ